MPLQNIKKAHSPLWDLTLLMASCSGLFMCCPIANIRLVKSASREYRSAISAVAFLDSQQCPDIQTLPAAVQEQ